jgi:hypothetical protein
MSFVKWVFTIVSGVILFSACGYGMYLYLSENKRLCEEGLKETRRNRITKTRKKDRETKRTEI